MMGYEIVKKHSRSSEGRVAVSLGTGGIVYISAKAMRDFFRDVKHVHVLYDAAQKRVAIQPLKSKQPNSFKLNFSTPAREATGMFTCRSFLKELHLDGASIKGIPAVWDEKKKFLELGLPKR